MNIFGNALKYTQKGSIVVKVGLEDVEDVGFHGGESRVLEIRISDTGKGISSEYLRTSLFNRESASRICQLSTLTVSSSAFCQEDPLASGTGLGLSIVRSIVTMLTGSIDVQSELGQGTAVTIRLPLSRLPGNSTPSSTPNSAATDESGPAHDSIDALRTDFSSITVCLYSFDETGVPNRNMQSGRVLKDCIQDWFGLKVASSTIGTGGVDLLIVDEKELSRLIEHDSRSLPTVVLCSNATRSQATSRQHRLNRPIVEYVSKPVGPHKLAKALHICLDRAKAMRYGLAPALALSDEESPMESEADTIVPDLEHLTLEPVSPSAQPLQVQTNGVLTASDSTNAQKAIGSSSYEAVSEEARVDDRGNFPFPIQGGTCGGERIDQAHEGKSPAKNERPTGDLVRQDSRRPPLISRMTEPAIRVPFNLASNLTKYDDEMRTYAVRPPTETAAAAKREVLSEMSPASLTIKNIALHNGELPVATTPVQPPLEREKRPPRLLLVDDNKINLRLLETYMKKRKYRFVDSAEDGQLAVQAAEAHDGYDIIFMGEHSIMSTCLV